MDEEAIGRRRECSERQRFRRWQAAENRYRMHNERLLSRPIRNQTCVFHRRKPLRLSYNMARRCRTGKRCAAEEGEDNTEKWLKRKRRERDHSVCSSLLIMCSYLF